MLSYKKENSDESNENKKRCLLILPKDIFPIDCGYSIKNYNLIKILGNQYHLKLVVLTNKDLDKKALDFYNENSAEIYIYKYPKQRYYFNALLTLLTNVPLQVGFYYFRKIQKDIDNLLRDCDIAIAGLVRTIRYLDNAPKNFVKVFDMVDSIGLIYQRAKDKSTSMIWKIIYQIESTRLLRYEKMKITSSAITYLFNQDECDYWKNYGKTQWLPHGVNNDLFNYCLKDSKYQNSVAFIGKMNYQPNVEAVRWYLENVHVNIGNHIPFVIVGSSPSEEVIKMTKNYNNVSLTGFVDDPYLILNSVLALVAPMQTGGGIQNKVLEGMALGKINIISSVAAKPILGTEDMKHYIIADSPEDYYKYLNQLSENPDIYKHIEEAAKQHIKDNFTWEAYGKAYLEGIELELSRL